MQYNFVEKQKESSHRIKQFYIAFLCTFIGVMTGYSGYDVYEAFDVTNKL